MVGENGVRNEVSHPSARACLRNSPLFGLPSLPTGMDLDDMESQTGFPPQPDISVVMWMDGS